VKPLEKISGKHSRTEGAQRTSVRASSAQLQNDGVEPRRFTSGYLLAAAPRHQHRDRGTNTAAAIAGPTLLPLSRRPPR